MERPYAGVFKFFHGPKGYSAFADKYCKSLSFPLKKMYKGVTMRKIVYILGILFIYGLIWFAQASQAAQVV